MFIIYNYLTYLSLFNLFIIMTLQLGDKHIMLSYNWGVQDVVRTTYEYIESIGIPVWMDIKGGVSG